MYVYEYLSLFLRMTADIFGEAYLCQLASST